MSWVVDGRFRRPKQMSHPADWIRDRMRLVTTADTPTKFRTTIVVSTVPTVGTVELTGTELAHQTRAAVSRGIS